MCAGLSGDSSLSAALVDRARQRKLIGSLDLRLVERIAATGTGTQRNANVDWSEARRLNVFRFGIATAAGVDIPMRLFRTVGPQVQAWRARAARSAEDNSELPPPLRFSFGASWLHKQQT